jgi:hypothetical protein
MKKIFLTICAVCLLLVMSTFANAALTFYEGFDYAYGELSTISAGVWVPHSGAILGQWSTMNVAGDVSAGTSLAYIGLTSPTGNRVLKAAFMTEDVHRVFDAVTTGDLYFSALIKVTTTPTNEHYFLSFNEGPIFTSLFRGRVFCTATTGGVTFGLSWAGAAGGATNTGTFALNSTHLIVVKLTMLNGAANDTAVMWVDPVSLGGSEPAPYAQVDSGGTNVNPLNGINAFDLRAATANQHGNIEIDEIRVGTLWADVTPIINPYLVPVELSHFSAK